MNNLDKQYQELVKTILDYGVSKGDRTGTGTKSIFGYTIRHNMKEGFPLLTTKKMAIKALMTELKWFLKGDTNIKYLVENNCNIWNGDAYRHYQFMNALATDIDFISMNEFVDKIKTDDKFCEMYGELGPVYGKQWRRWSRFHPTMHENGYTLTAGQTNIDQIQNLINDLKKNPDSRRLMVNAWNVGELDKMVLPPCHYGFQVYTRELSKDERMDYWFKNNKPNRDVCDSVDESSEEEQHKYFDSANVPKRAISLMWNQRSVDTFLGLPFNIASYATLLMLIADEVNMIPEDLIGNLGDVHLYNNHIEQAEEIITREPYKLPKLEITNCDIMNGEFDYEILNYEYHPTIKAPLSN